MVVYVDLLIKVCFIYNSFFLCIKAQFMCNTKKEILISCNVDLA